MNMKFTTYYVTQVRVYFFIYYHTENIAEMLFNLFFLVKKII